jgi:hypothetical protein
VVRRAVLLECRIASAAAPYSQMGQRSHFADILLMQLEPAPLKVRWAANERPGWKAPLENV